MRKRCQALSAPICFRIWYTGLMEMKFVTTAEAARELNVSSRMVRFLLAQDRIPGAMKVGRDWVIPSPVRVLTRYGVEALARGQ